MERQQSHEDPSDEVARALMTIALHSYIEIYAAFVSVYPF